MGTTKNDILTQEMAKKLLRKSANGKVTVPGNIKRLENGCFVNADVKEVILPEGITTIGDNAFHDCIDLREVHFPSLLKSIGEAAFSGCISLENLDFSQTQIASIPVLACRNCTSLQKVILPPHTERILKKAFHNCSGLTTINLNEVCEIGTEAFYNCTMLLDSPLNNLKKFGNSAFYGCKSLHDITIPDGVPGIPDKCFAFCAGLNHVSCQYVDYIGFQAFNCCTSLETITLPSNFESHGNIFSSCSNLRELTNLKAMSSLTTGDLSDCSNFTLKLSTDEAIELIKKFLDAPSIEIN